MNTEGETETGRQRWNMEMSRHMLDSLDLARRRREPVRRSEGQTAGQTEEEHDAAYKHPTEGMESLKGQTELSEVYP